MNGSKNLIRILSFSLIGVIFILAFALVVTLRTNRDAELARIVDEQPGAQERVDQNESGQPTEIGPEEILSAQKTILVGYGHLKRRGATEEKIASEVKRRRGPYVFHGYPEAPLQLEVALQAVTEHLRDEIAALDPSTPSSVRLKRTRIALAWRMGISADDLSFPATEEKIEKAKAIVNEIIRARSPEEVARSLEPLTPIGLSNEELALIAEIVPQLDTPQAIPVIDFLAAYRDRKICVKLFHELSKSDDMELVKHGFDSFGRSRADEVVDILCHLFTREDVPQNIRLSVISPMEMWDFNEKVSEALASELDKGTEEWQINVLKRMSNFSLVSFHNILTDAVLKKAMTGNDDVTRAALGPLTHGPIRDQRIRPLLREIAGDESRADDIRLQAFKVISERSDPDSLKMAERLLGSESAQIRQTAESALKQIQERMERDTPEGRRRENIEHVQELIDEWQAARAHIAGRTDPESREALNKLDGLIKQAQEALEQWEKE